MKTKRNNTIKRIPTLPKASLAFIFIFPSIIRNTPLGRPESGQAEYYFVSHNQELIPGQTFTVEVRIRAKTAVNAIGARLSFSPNVVEILNMNTEESFCSFYLDNSFDNIKGSIDLSCGKETPGFQGDATVMVLHLRSKTHGKAVFNVFSDSTVSVRGRTWRTL